jgi:hypothetical protein
MRATILFLLALSAAAPALAEVPVPGATDDVYAFDDHTDAWRAHLATERATAIARLTEYAEARNFPVNTTDFGALSQLRDSSGTPCAMAYLVEQSGHTALIDQLSVTANGIKFGTLTEGALYDWTLTSGLTLDETAMVQEPGFFAGDELGQYQEPVMQSEEDRLYSHFSVTTQMLQARTEMSLDHAVAALGDLVRTAPPVANYSDEWRTYFGAQRTQHIDNLREYTAAGVFPQNDFQLGLTSMLRDATGRPCAMAYVIETSGHTDLIDTLVASNNTVRFDGLTGGELYDWTLTSGLLLEEAAMVQVPDMGWDMGMDPDFQEQLQLVEVARIQAHLTATALALEAANSSVIDTAIERLGDRVNTPPPADVTLASL